MPFGPMLRRENWESAFAVELSPIHRAATEMTLALPVRDEFAHAAPAGVHADGSARPQVVDETQDPWLHKLLAVFEAKGGCPALVNTSLNHHREPIVCTGDEALHAARSAGLDAVVVGGELHRL